MTLFFSNNFKHNNAETHSNNQKSIGQSIPAYTVKRVDEVVRHPHLVTHDQFTQVSKKVSDIPEENFNINIDVFQQNFTNVELLRYKHIPNVELLDDEHGTYPHFLQM
jgi:hypothetical protein